MGRRRSQVSGVRAKGTDRIEFEIYIGEKRYRPTVKRPPTPANLRRARVQLDAIDKAIAAGTFDFAQEFPDYRLKDRLPTPPVAVPTDEMPEADFEEILAEPLPPAIECAPASAPTAEAVADVPKKTCSQVFKSFLAHCQARVAMNDMAYSTYSSYRQILESVWEPRIGEEEFLEVTYSRLQSIIASYAAKIEETTDADEKNGTTGASSITSDPSDPPLKKSTYNNMVSALRCAFEHGYRDFPEKHNPALRLKTLRITKKDREPPDPFTLPEAELIIARSHQEFGEAHGNYEELRFFTGLRPSEQIALKVCDYDVSKGTLRVARARVRRREKDRTKTNDDRVIELCPRAIEVLRRQLRLREQLVNAGLVRHEFIFFQADGAPIIHLSYPWKRWRYVLEVTGVRYREPYNARHSFISWSLMIGKNLLKLAQEDGHSVQTMLATYAAWINGATEGDITLIKQAMQCAPARETCPSSPPVPPAIVTTSSLGSSLGGKAQTWGRLSWRKNKHLNPKTQSKSQTSSAGIAIKKWRSGRDSNPRPPA